MVGGGWPLLFLLRFPDFVRRCAASACSLCLLTYARTFLRSLAMMRSVLGSVIVSAVGASCVDAFRLLAEVGASRSTGGSLLYVGMHWNRPSFNMPSQLADICFVSLSARAPASLTTVMSFGQYCYRSVVKQYSRSGGILSIHLYSGGNQVRGRAVSPLPVGRLLEPKA